MKAVQSEVSLHTHLGNGDHVLQLARPKRFFWSVAASVLKVAKVLGPATKPNLSSSMLATHAKPFTTTRPPVPRPPRSMLVSPHNPQLTRRSIIVQIGSPPGAPGGGAGTPGGGTMPPGGGAPGAPGGGNPGGTGKPCIHIRHSTWTCIDACLAVAVSQQCCTIALLHTAVQL